MYYKKKSSLSIVSHGQIDLVKVLLSDLEVYSDHILEILLTFNIPEELDLSCYKNKITLIKNTSVKGFGSNHNYAFSMAKGEYFFILNPDLRINSFDFEAFIKKLNFKKTGLLTPSVINIKGNAEDHIRDYPTIDNLIKRFFLESNSDSNFQYQTHEDNLIDVNWVAGMFMAFKMANFKKLNGFDDNFFLYLEDVDICKRTQKMGLKVCVDTSNKVMHDAQRASHKSFRLFIVHCLSYIKYFKKWGLFN